jgi:hypothetical protein
MGTKQAVAKAKRLIVVGLAALLLVGGGTASLDGGNAVLAGGSQPGSSTGDEVQGRERPGEEIPTEREDDPTAQAGSGAINGGGEF